MSIDIKALRYICPFQLPIKKWSYRSSTIDLTRHSNSVKISNQLHGNVHWTWSLPKIFQKPSKGLNNHILCNKYYRQWNIMVHKTTGEREKEGRRKEGREGVEKGRGEKWRGWKEGQEGEGRRGKKGERKGRKGRNMWKIFSNPFSIYKCLWEVIVLISIFCLDLLGESELCVKQGGDPCSYKLYNPRSKILTWYWLSCQVYIRGKWHCRRKATCPLLHACTFETDMQAVVIFLLYLSHFRVFLHTFWSLGCIYANVR
jgi:hypothetical protein